MASNDPLAQILGSLLGGAAQPSNSGATMPGGGTAQGLDLGGLLAAITGGAPTSGGVAAGSPTGQPGIGDIVGAVLGGNHAGIANSDALNPISAELSARTGISPTVSHAVLAFAAAALVQEMVNRQQGQGKSLDVHELINRANSGQGLDRQYLNATGLPQQLAQHTGLDPNIANQGLQQALTLMAPLISARAK